MKCPTKSPLIREGFFNAICMLCLKFPSAHSKPTLQPFATALTEVSVFSPPRSVFLHSIMRCVFSYDAVVDLSISISCSKSFRRRLSWIYRSLQNSSSSALASLSQRSFASTHFSRPIASISLQKSSLSKFRRQYIGLTAQTSSSVVTFAF